MNLKFKHRLKQIRGCRHAGQTVNHALHQHALTWSDGSKDLSLPQLEYRMVEEDGQKWFEVGFATAEPLGGDAPEGFQDFGGYLYLDLEYSADLQNWARGKFGSAQVTEQGDGSFEYWCRAENPAAASVRTGALVCDMVNGDPRNGPITSIVLADVAQALPNYPYTMPDDAAQLQADLIALGWTGSVVTAESVSRWTIAIPDVDFTTRAQTSSVRWPGYTKTEFNPLAGGEVTVTIDRAPITGQYVNADGTPINVTGFARMRALAGWRHGGEGPVDPPYWLPPEYVPPSAGGTSGTGGGIADGPPYMSVAAPAITGSHAPGATLTRPTYTWVSQGGSPMTVVGEWYKNGVGTGESGETYSDTVDGDVIEYREVATNDFGSSGYTSWRQHAVSVQVEALSTESRTAIEALLAGLPGGAANMNVFSVEDHATPSYTRNPDMWASSLVGDGLAAAAAWKTAMSSEDRYGGVLITPRHLLYCEHAHPHANGTWLVNPSSGAMMIRFVLADNTLVETEQVSQTTRNESGFGYYDPGFWLDLCVATLADDVAAQGVPIIPIMAVRSDAERTALNAINVPVFDVSQGARAWGTPPQPISDYPQFHQAMVAIGPPSVARDSPPLDLFDYTVWSGDSGTPTFVLHRGQAYLEGIMLYAGWGRVRPGQYIDQINEMIAVADADAVARGRIPSPTGLTVSSTVLPTD